MRNISHLIVCLALLNPVLLMAASTVEGQKIYERNCAMCHGAQGVSVMASAPSFKYGEGLFASDLSLVEHIQKGKNACPAFIGLLREQQTYDVIAYLRTLYQ